jgi:hypothetical protein
MDVSTSLSAETELVIPASSEDSVEFTCEVTGTAVEGYSPLWEISGRQIPSTSENNFIITTTPEKRSSNLTVTQQGRQFVGLQEISVECHADNPVKFRLVRGKETLFIIQFDAPGAVENLELVYSAQSDLRLQWIRPSDLPSVVPVSYYINITNTDTGSVEQSYETMETSVSVDQTTTQTCQSHTFTVTANNTAGHGPPATIIHSIPISLNITPVEQSQRVSSLSLSASTGPNITVSFTPATSCGAQFPVINHTVGVEGLEGEVVVAPGSSLVSVSLTPATIPQLVLDQVLSIVITACTKLTCLTPTLPIVAVTTDTQEASVVFYSTAVSLNCSFAVGSSATGCLFVFKLTNQDRTDNVSVGYTETGDGGPMFNTSCDFLTNTRGAYDAEVQVYDIERDGSIGPQAITAIVTVDEDPDNFTCPLPTNEIERTREVLSPGAIAGITVASTLVLLLLLITAALFIMILLLARKEKKTHPELTWPESVNGVIVRVKNFDPLKWLGHLATDGATDGDGEKDNFVAGREDTDIEV